MGEFIVVRGTISDEALEKTESYLSSKWSIPLDRTMEKKFSDNSGGNRNLLYSGQEISPDNKFNSTIAFNGSTDFAYIPIIGDTYKISTSEVTRFDLCMHGGHLMKMGPIARK